MLEYSIDPSHVGLLNTLPTELIIQILQNVFPSWSASVNYDFDSGPVPNAQVLNTCRLFRREGEKLIKNRFNGTIVVSDSVPKRHQHETIGTKQWLEWIRQNVDTIESTFSIFIGYYIHRFWSDWPSLKRLRLRVPQGHVGDLTFSPWFDDCTLNMNRLASGKYIHNFDFLHLSSIMYYGDLEAYPEVEAQWPLIQYDFHDCECHPDRSTVITATRVEVRRDVRFLIDATFEVSAFFHADGHFEQLHAGLVDCAALPGRRFQPAGLETVHITHLERAKWKGPPAAMSIACIGQGPLENKNASLPSSLASQDPE